MTSSFASSGQITPNEFVAAGDYLVEKWPFWSWYGDSVRQYKDFLPYDKQYLVTRGVLLCPDKQNISENVLQDDCDWTDMNINKKLVSDKPHGSCSNKSSIIVDLDTSPSAYNYDEDEQVIEEDDPLRIDNNLVVIDPNLNRRIYDLHITYDKYYATPRLWIIGYTLGNLPLTYDQVFRDISQDHKRSTVTVEMHPYLNKLALCVHPCKHANMFKQLCDKTGNYDVKRVLELFLRIMITILPTVDFAGHGMS